uniref:Uncharacterized protein n=1 Tax=Pseudomonas marincola TaxID=437900 RepID=A0A653E0V6_9PSED
MNTTLGLFCAGAIVALYLRKGSCKKALALQSVNHSAFRGAPGK